MGKHNPVDVMHSRKIELEELFFLHHDQELLAKMREKYKEERMEELLAEATGIQDKNLLHHIFQIGIRPETLIVISLIPLVQVAWADGLADTKEKNYVMWAAEAIGIAKETPAHQLLEYWLEKQPDPLLYQAWSEYIHLIRPKLDRHQWEKLRAEVLGKALDVAESSGGILGLGSVSSEEKATLSKLQRIFDGE